MKRFILGLFGIIVHILFIVTLILFLIDLIAWIIVDYPIEDMYLWTMGSSVIGILIWNICNKKTTD